MIDLNISKQLHGVSGVMELDVNLSIPNGQFVAIMGQSGSAKTSLLRILAGLDEANGEILVDKKFWLNHTYSLECQKREIGFLFQGFALFENMTVLENLLYVNGNKEFALTLLDMVDMVDMQHRDVLSLSGGQKQRVALCRAMILKPKILLLDEPLSSLDANMKIKLEDEIVKFHKKFGTTTIMVSHDANSAYKMADRVVVLDRGKIVADGSANDVLEEKRVTSYEIKSLNKEHNE